MIDHPMLHTNEFRAVVVTLCSGGACGFPINHPGNHIANHALVSCLDLQTCALCLYRSNGRLARYGLTPESLGDIFARAREKRAAIDAQRSPHGCLKCALCFPDHEPVAGERVEISSHCLSLMQIEMAFARG